MGHQTGLFAASIAALVIACIAGWAVPETQARVATTQIDPFAMMTSAKQLPTEHFQDYSFVY
jgi:predicted Co/Zn/Cd cation transporter (cation efflux family)